MQSLPKHSRSTTHSIPTLKSVGHVHRVIHHQPIPTVHILPVESRQTVIPTYRSVAISHIKALRAGKTVTPSRLDLDIQVRPICRHTILNDATLQHVVASNDPFPANAMSPIDAKMGNIRIKQPHIPQHKRSSTQTVVDHDHPAGPPPLASMTADERRAALNALHAPSRANYGHHPQSPPARPHHGEKGKQEGSQNTINYQEYIYRLHFLETQLEKLDALESTHRGHLRDAETGELHSVNALPFKYDNDMLSLVAKQYKTQRMHIEKQLEHLKTMTVLDAPTEDGQSEADSAQLNTTEEESSTPHSKLNTPITHHGISDSPKDGHNDGDNHDDDAATAMSSSDYDRSDMDLTGITLKPPKLLALDVGTRYIGLAVSNDQLTAGEPLTVIQLLLPFEQQRVVESPLRNGPYRERFVDPNTLAQKLNTIRKQLNVVCTVVGLPDTADNPVIHHKIRNFVDNMQQLNGLGPGYEVAFVDEHHTSLLAKEKMMQHENERRNTAPLVGAGGERSKRLRSNSQAKLQAQKSNQLDAEAAAFILNRFLELLPMFGEKYAAILDEEDHLETLQKQSHHVLDQPF